MSELRLILLVLGVLLVGVVWFWGARGRHRRSGPSGDAPVAPRDARRNASPAPDGAPGTKTGGVEGEGAAKGEGAAGEGLEGDPGEVPAEGAPAGGPAPEVFPGALPVTALQGFRAIREELEQIDLAGLHGVGAGSPSAPGVRIPSASSRESAPAGESLVVVLTVIARRGEKLSGATLRAALEARDLRYGENGLFHCRASGDPPGAAPLFSVINAVQPGVFDPNTIDSMTTPGIGLFMCLPGPKDPEAAFERMVGAGRRLASALDAQLCDETRSTLSAQVLNHLRERIAEHGRQRRRRT